MKAFSFLTIYTTSKLEQKFHWWGSVGEAFDQCLVNLCSKLKSDMIILGRLVLLSLLMIHNWEKAECYWYGPYYGYGNYDIGKVAEYANGLENRVYTYSNWAVNKLSNSNHKLDKKDIDPEAAFGFLTLNKAYNKYESPDKEKTSVEVHMEPTFVTKISSVGRKMGLEIKLGLAWEDERIWWKKDNITEPGDVFTFEPSILK